MFYQNKTCFTKNNQWSTLAIIIGIAFLIMTPVHAEEVILYTFNVDDDLDNQKKINNAPAATALHISGTEWSDLDGAFGNDLTQDKISFRGIDSNDVPPIPAGVAAGARSFHDGNALEFTLSVAAGFLLDLTGYSFNEQGSGGSNGAGPTAWSLEIASVAVASGSATPGTAAFHNGGLSLGNLQGDILVQLFGTGSTSTNSNASWRADNFRFEGTISAVPLPGAVMLMAPALFGLWRIGRRASSAQVGV